MRRITALFAALALVAAACSGNSDDTPSVSSTSTTTSTVAQTTMTVAAPNPGRLAVLGEDGNVFTIAPDGTDRIDLTNDAGGETTYFQPIWAPDGERVTYGSTSTTGSALVTTAADGTSFATATETPPFYFYWDEAGERVAYLHSAASGGLTLHVVDGAGGEPALVTSGQPLYFSWEPFGSRIIGHIGVDRLELFDGGESTALGQLPGIFQAPAWTPAGLWYVVDDGDQQVLTIGQPDGSNRPVARFTGSASFTIAPDGTKAAVQSFVGDTDAVTAAFQATPRLVSNRLDVVDLDGTVTNILDHPAAAFFWTPQGDKLLVLGVGSGRGLLQWRVWADGSFTDFDEFVPSVTLLTTYLPFFDQYAQSMSLWSPDGASFAFPGVVGGERGIFVQDITGGSPTLVSDGNFVAWSSR